MFGVVTSLLLVAWLDGKHVVFGNVTAGWVLPTFPDNFPTICTLPPCSCSTLVLFVARPSGSLRCAAAGRESHPLLWLSRALLVSLFLLLLICCFVRHSMDVVKEIESYGSKAGKTSKKIVVKDCGEL